MKFTTMKQGYNRYEVDTCVKRLEEEIEELNLKLKLYKNKTEELIFSKNELLEKYNELSLTLQIREKASDDVSRSAIREANAVIEKAHKNAEFILQEAFVSARLILLEVSKLGGATNELKGQLKEKVDQLNELIQNFQDFPTIDETKLK